MDADFDRAKREQNFRFSCRIFGDLQILAEGFLGLRQVFQFRGCVPQIKQKVRLDAAAIVDISQSTQIFFGSFVVFLLVIFDSEPLENFWRHIHPAIAGLSHETVHLFGERGPIFQIKLTQNEPKRCQVVVLFLI